MMKQRAQSFLNVLKTPVWFIYVNCLQIYFSQQDPNDYAVILIILEIYYIEIDKQIMK